MIKFICSILSGFIAAPLIILWSAFEAFVAQAMYDKLVVPIAALYEKGLPDVPWWQWLALMVVIGFFNISLKGVKPKQEPAESQHGLCVKVASLIAIWASAYIVNWIWL